MKKIVCIVVVALAMGGCADANGDATTTQALSASGEQGAIAQTPTSRVVTPVPLIIPNSGAAEPLDNTVRPGITNPRPESAIMSGAHQPGIVARRRP